MALESVNGENFRPERAATVALDALQGYVDDAPAALARARHEAFRSKWRMNRALRELVASPRAVAWAARGAQLCPAAVRRLIALAGDVPRA
jgi:hypothetical protein